MADPLPTPDENPTRGPVPWEERLRLIIPSTGALTEGTLDLLSAADARVNRVSSRRYAATIPSMPGIRVNYQRQSNITTLLDLGSADLGIVGRDRFFESRREGGETLILAPDLQFGRSRLRIAVSDSWTNVRTIGDLAERAVGMNNRGRPLRVATKYPRLVRRFLQRRGVAFFELVEIDGALEAAPRLGYADVIADISDTGNTLRENELRPIRGGIVRRSVAVLVGNGKNLADSDIKLETAKALLERIEASLEAREYRRVTANVRGDSEQSVADRLLQTPELAGTTGPTVSKVWTSDAESWFAVQVVVPREHVQAVVNRLRAIGGGTSTVTELDFLYRPTSELSADLDQQLADMRAAGEI